MGAYLVFNVGGTGMRIAIFVNGELVAFIMLKTDGCDYAASLRRLISAAKQLVVDKGVTVAAVGVAFAGEWNDEGLITGSGNLPGWHGFNFKQDLVAAFGLPVVVLGDCEAEALGEGMTLGRSCVYIGFGTGVGCGVFSLTESGHKTSKAELGHLIFAHPSELRCGCKGYGHVEAHIGGANLSARFKVASWKELTTDHWQTIVTDMGIFLREIPALGDPYKGLPIIVGGSVGLAVMNDPKRRALLLTTIATEKSTVAPPEVVAAMLEEPALVGAACAARELVKQ